MFWQLKYVKVKQFGKFLRNFKKKFFLAQKMNLCEKKDILKFTGKT